MSTNLLLLTSSIYGYSQQQLPDMACADLCRVQEEKMFKGAGVGQLDIHICSSPTLHYKQMTT